MRDPAGVLNRQDWRSLERPLNEAGADPSVVIPMLREFATQVLRWNSGISNLLSHNDEARIVSRHIMESLEPASWIRPMALGHVLDFGSGAGFPAIPLAIAGIGERWTLVDSRRNKTLFLRKALSEIGLTNISVVCSRLEDITSAPEHMGAYSAMTSRATAKIPETLALASALVAPGGKALLWKGSGSAEELAGPREWEATWAIEGEHVIGEGPTRVIHFSRQG